VKDSSDLTDEQWRARLTADQYRVLRQSGTEAPFAGHLVDEHGTGTFRCAGCGGPLFGSGAKFDSGSGWPSFFEPLAPEHIVEETDQSQGMVRTEVRCARCDGHLGHVFPDGPRPSGLRYCINSVALDFDDEPR